MIVHFVDREDELNALERLHAEGKAALVLLYGRRRVGKTRLIQEFMRGKRGLYFYVPNAEDKTVMAELSRVVEAEFFKGFRFSDFASFMEYLSEKCRFLDVIAFDEFQRLMSVNGAISMLQKYWDERFSKGSSIFIFSGSSMGAVRKVALRGDAPLYGRRTLTIKMEPLRYLDLLEWFKRYSPEELVWVYASFGGTPAYLEHVNEAESVEENIMQKILSKRAPLHDEPEMLLMEELRTPQRYMDILSAISQGKNTMSEIADAAGLSRENTTTYLKMLEVLDLIERVTPITDPKAKKGIYRIKDPFFAFWFGFVRPNKRQLEFGLERNIWENIKEEFKTHLSRVFEDICAEAIAEMARKGCLPMKVGKVGKWWWKDYEIDIVGLMGRKALAIEAKWKELNLQEARRLLYQLNHKARHIHGADEHILGIMAKKIEDKQRIRDEGFIALDIQDIAHFAKQEAASSRQ